MFENRTLNYFTFVSLTFSSGERASLFLNVLLALRVVAVDSVNLVMCSRPPSFHVPSDVTYKAPR